MCYVTDAYCSHRMRNQITLNFNPARQPNDEKCTKERTNETNQRKAPTTILIIPSTNA